MEDTYSRFVAIGNTGPFESGFIADSFERIGNFIQSDIETPYSLSLSPQNGDVICKYGTAENESVYKIRRIKKEDASAIDAEIENGLTFSMIKDSFGRADPIIAPVIASESKSNSTIAFNESAIAQELMRGCELYNPFTCMYVASDLDSATITIANVSLDSVARYLGERATPLDSGIDLIDRFPSTVVDIERDPAKKRFAEVAEFLSDSPGAFASLSPSAACFVFEAFERYEDSTAFRNAVSKYGTAALEAWFANVDEDIMSLSTDWPPCWGGCMRVSDQGDYVALDDYDMVLSSERDRDLYLALCYSPEAGGAGDIPIVDIFHNINDVDWLAENASSQIDRYSTVFYTEAYPSDFTEEELADLSLEKPHLFTDEELRMRPMLAKALESSRPSPSAVAAAANSSATRQIASNGVEKASVIRSV